IARPSAEASASTRLTASALPGRATQRGARPSTAYAATALSSLSSCSRPTAAPSASSSAGDDTAIGSDPGAGGELRAAGAKGLAARRMRRQELFRVHDPVGIEDTAEPRHEAEVGGRELKRHGLRLVGAHPVLTRHAAAEGEARAEKLLVRRLGALELALHAVVVEDHRMQVAVAGVKDGGDREPMTSADGAHLAHDLGEARARDHRVLEEPVPRHAPDDARRFLASLPQERALRLV